MSEKCEICDRSCCERTAAAAVFARMSTLWVSSAEINFDEPALGHAMRHAEACRVTCEAAKVDWRARAIAAEAARDAARTRAGHAESRFVELSEWAAAAEKRAREAEALGAVGYELLGRVLRGIEYLPFIMETDILSHLDAMEKAQPRLVLATPPKEKP